MPTSTAPQPVLLADVEEGHSLWQDAWARLRKNRLAVLSGVILLLLALVCGIGPIFAQDYAAQDLARYATKPSAQHWFGTDTLGRDLFSRVLTGGQVSFSVGLCATVVALLIGVTFGTVSGYYGGRVDMVMMRFVDILYSIPFPIFVILLMVLFQRSFLLIFAAIGLVHWLTMARIVRSAVLSIRRMEYIEAAEATGVPRKRIIFRHVLPNVLGPVIIYTTLTIPAVMLLEAFLSYLGLGVQPPLASWGVLISEGARSMEEFPWLLLYPAIALSLTLFCLNFLGDGLRDALDPKASKD